MMGPSVRQQLRTFIKYMHDQGILDQHFEYLREIHNPESPRFVSDTIITFINDADVTMAAVTLLLNDDEVNFDILISNVHQLQGSSRGIGSCRMVRVCEELQHACEERNNERCLEIFENLKEEYRTLRDALNYIRQLEEAIHSHETRRRRQP